MAGNNNDRFSNDEVVDMLLIFGEMRQNSRAASVRYAEVYPIRVQPRHQWFPVY